ncbi:MAG: hypothetical protein JXE06_07810 [Coriobacteriia bacterium]|nr:hypothetical protein [Coriobacteriia bacterium]
MKKTLFVVALAAMLIFALGGAAMAKNSVSQYPAAGDGTPAQDLLIYNDWTGHLANLAGNAGYTSPHGGYATTTVKCAVCHAVHVASPNGDTLLKMRASDACVACHVAAQLGGTSMVYGGSATIANDSGQDHHATGTNCSRCHASVHGAGSIQDVPSITSIILAEVTGTDEMNPREVNSWITTGTAIAGLTTAQVDTLLANDNTAATREVAIGLFCQGCHSGSYQNGVAGTLGNGNDGVAIGDRTGHRVGASVVANLAYNTGANEVFNYALDETSTASYAGQVAWSAASDCKSCHDATQFADGSGGLGFPHFTQGAARFLNMGAAADATFVPIGVSVSADDAYLGEETNSVGFIASSDLQVKEFSLRDGACLKCHKGTATTGVGQEY